MEAAEDGVGPAAIALRARRTTTIGRKPIAATYNQRPSHEVCKTYSANEGVRGHCGRRSLSRTILFILDGSDEQRIACNSIISARERAGKWHRC